MRTTHNNNYRYIGRSALTFPLPPLLAPEEIREITSHDENAEIVITRYRFKQFVVFVRDGRRDVLGLMGSAANPGTVAIFGDLKECIMKVMVLTSTKRVFFDLT